MKQPFIAAADTPLKLQRRLQFYTIDDGRFFHVFDPTTSRHFRMGRQEVGWLKLLDGVRTTECLRNFIPAEHFDGFVTAMDRLGLVERRRVTRRSLVEVLRLKLHLVNPNKILNALGSFPVTYRVVLNRASGPLLLLNVLLLTRLDSHVLSALREMSVTPSRVAFYILSFLLMGFCHEASHAVIAKSFGVNVPSLGMMLLYGHPSFYADVSGIRLLIRQAARLRVLLAGVMANNALSAAALLLNLVVPLALRPYVLSFALMNFVAGVMNLIPFVEFDGYYVVQDLLTATAPSRSEGTGLGASKEGTGSREHTQHTKKGGRRAEDLLLVVLSTIFSAALISLAIVALRKYALHIMTARYANPLSALTLFLAYGAVVVKRRRFIFHL